MADEELCETILEYQPPWRTVLETILCLLIIVSYIPQYVKIVRSNSTYAISSRFVLFHCLFSTCVLGVRLSHLMFYRALTCVEIGPYRGWKAYSALLGFIQAIVQFVCAVILLALYLRHRTLAQPDHLVEHPEPGLSSRTMLATASTVAITVVPVSAWFLWHYNSIDHDDETTIDHWVIVYRLCLGIWHLLLIPSGVATLVTQFIYEIGTVRALKSHGALSMPSLLLQAVVLPLLAVAQFLRSGYLSMTPIGSISNLLEPLWGFYFSIHAYTMYFISGLGFLGLFVICMVEGGFEGSGRIRL